MNDKTTRSRGLGRGLSALMADVGPQEDAEAKPRSPDMAVPIERIHPNRDQPRRQFQQEQLEELADSIKARGVIQPLIVRPRPGHEGDFEIVAGERRWRAAQLAQLHSLPVLVREFDDTEVLEVAIIENIQRENLNAVEEAAGYRQLMDKFGHTQERLAEALGKSRSHIANLMRLLNLPEPVQDYVRNGQLSAGHARALITAEHPEKLAQQIVKNGLSVREAERLAKKQVDGGESGAATKSRSTAKVEKDADTRAIEGDLSASLKMKVSIDHAPGGEGGKMTISYHSFEQLDDLCRMLGGL